MAEKENQSSLECIDGVCLIVRESNKLEKEEEKKRMVEIRKGEEI